jgi:2-hydroxy-3-keto-5-methylthiopentenyl-1-phosphate phosphatase
MLFLMPVVEIISKAFVFTIFWKWFIVSVFTQLPTLTFLQSVGILMIAFLFQSNTRFRRKKSKEKKDSKQPEIKEELNDLDGFYDEIIENVLRKVILFPGLSLFFGWVVHSIMF